MPSILDRIDFNDSLDYFSFFIKKYINMPKQFKSVVKDNLLYIDYHLILKGTLLHSLLILNRNWHCANEMSLKIICDHSNFPCLFVHMLAKSTSFVLKFVGISTP